jgi:hypothetical protein
MSSTALAIVTLLAVATIAGLVLRLLGASKRNDFRRDDNTALIHAGAGHAIAHDGGYTPSCGDASGFCGDGGGGSAF